MAQFYPAPHETPQQATDTFYPISENPTGMR